MRNPLRTLLSRLFPSRFEIRYVPAELAWCYMCQHGLFKGHGHIAKNGAQISASTIRWWTYGPEDLDVPTFLRRKLEWPVGQVKIEPRSVLRVDVP